jgi:hypothetical protein
MRVLVVLCVSAWLIAGCLGEAPAVKSGATTGAGAPPSTTAAEPTTGVDTGSIAGLALDDEQRPLKGVKVGILETHQEATSDDVGAFTFNELAPGSYGVFSDLLGYESASKKVDVLAGEVTKVSLILKPIPIPVARTQGFVSEVYLELAAAVVATTVHRNVTGAEYRDIYYTVENDAVSAVSGMQWQSSAPGSAKRFTIQLWAATKSCDDLCEKLNETSGVSPVIVRSDDFQTHFEGKKGTQVNPTVLMDACYTAGSTDVSACNQDTLVHFAFQQRVNIYTTVFFAEPAPAGYSPLAPPA